MKINEVNRVAADINLMYGKPDFLENVEKISANTDMHIRVETFGVPIFDPTSSQNRTPVYTYARELELLKYELRHSKEGMVSLIMPEKNSEYNLLAYTQYLGSSQDTETVLYLFSPLYPVASTISILRQQLTYVTIIAIILAAVLSIYFSSRITKPISNMNKTAKQLAKGNFGVTFRGEHYSEIIELADTLTYTASELEKANTMQKDLIANVSHDLRTPLTMVKSYAEMIRDLSGDNPEKRTRHLQVIIDEADRLNVLVSDMLTMSRVQSGVITLEKSLFSIRDATEAIIKTYDVLTEQEGYIILFDCPDNIMVNGDEAKIKQVISNLINNAIKYCGADRTVYISVKKSHGKMRLEVTDRGMGMSQEDMPYIWNRYYKASTNHVRTTMGTGLGLSIVKNLLSLHKADFGVESQPGKGSTFWFTLPIEKNKLR
ncbi:MAG: HAMP domain-containing sensor histidine kinase [Eubacteriales bacterium]|nr:HAMP domain-containing sensor histidine kinase [Eubacteriales bacterium]MDD4390082.1 HAMP domain-containing sensor histidine kinase [Eubacteriales bacterium]